MMRLNAQKGIQLTQDAQMSTYGHYVEAPFQKLTNISHACMYHGPLAKHTN